MLITIYSRRRRRFIRPPAGETAMKKPLFALLGIFLCTGAGHSILQAQDAPSVLRNRIEQLSPGTRPSIALVLAGGGAWGLAHIGAVKVIEEAGIPVDIVVGTSMGSIIGGLYASGYNAAEMEEISVSADWGYLFEEGGASGRETMEELNARSRQALSAQFDRQGFFLNGGLISGVRIMRYLDSLLVDMPAQSHFDELPKRFRAIATDASSGERIVIDSGSVTDAMRASMSLPGIFTPFPYQGRFLVDGGVVDNLPVTVARSLGADIVIAVDLYNGKPLENDEAARSPTAVLSRSMEIMRHENSRREIPFADLVVSIDAQGFLPTQFERAKEFILLGEETTREYSKDLAGLRALLSEFEPAVHAEREKNPPLDGFTISGGSEKDRALVRSFIENLPDRHPSFDDLSALFSLLDRTGRIQAVRIHRKKNREGEYLEIALTEKNAKKNGLSLGFLYESTMGSSIVTDLDIMPAVDLRGLTTKDSNLHIEAEALDAPGISAVFHQPLGSFFTLSPFYRFERDFTTKITQSSVNWQYQTIVQTGGLVFGITPYPGIRISASWSVKGMEEGDIPEIPAVPEEHLYSLISGSFEVRRLDSPVFPMQGIDMIFRSTASLPALGSSIPFRVFETEGNTFLSLGTPFSVALIWQGATDFSLDPDAPGAAPAYFKPTVTNRRLFPGPLSIEERKGSHVMTAGMEIKHNLNWNSRGISFPAFFILQGAVGSTIQDLEHTKALDMMQNYMYASGSAGAGIRFSDAFGLSLRGGLHFSMEREIRPYITLDVGAIGKDRDGL